MAFSYASLKFKRKIRHIMLWKDDDAKYRWYYLNCGRVGKIKPATTIADSKINAWLSYREKFQVDIKCEKSLDKGT